MPKRYRNEGLNVTIDVTKAAERVIVRLPRGGFLSRLSEFMAEVGSDYAYVGAQGSNLQLNMVWLPESRLKQRLSARMEMESEGQTKCVIPEWILAILNSMHVSAFTKILPSEHLMF